MALILQVTVTNDETGEVEKTYVETVDSRTHSWEAAQLLRRFLARMFEIAYPGSDDW
jgi:GTP1/Obg family GTP-binding protein